MASIDTRVVKMVFDNLNFAKKSEETMSMLDKLKSKLSFSGASKGLQDLEAAQKQVKFEGMASAIDNLNNKFSVMGAVAFSVINNIVNRAIAAGTQIAKSLTIAPLTDGFTEYQTNMNSIQTILANTDSKGSTLEDVNAALDQLNEYSDLTIYNFAQMARNIGTFTAAGVDLDVSVNAIKGIANLAAISGSDANQAATAMYQLSQALSSGTVRLMDWNSVVNAGMGGEVFKSALYETGVALGKISNAQVGQSFEEWEAAGNNFRESLQDEWLTDDVLTTTLQAFTGDLNEAQLIQLGYTQEQAKEMQRLGELGVAAATEVKTITQLVDTIKEAIGTGWADTFRIVVGDFEQAKELLTNINNVAGDAIGKWSEARNLLLRQWAFLGGRDKLIDGLSDVMGRLSMVMDTVSVAWRSVFPATTAWDLLALTDGFLNFVNALIPTTEQLVHIRKIFTGVFSVLSIGWEVVKGVFGVFRDLFSAFGAGPANSLLEFLGDFGMSIFELKEDLVDGGGIAEFFDKIVPKIQEFVDKIDISPTLDRVSTAFKGFWESFTNLFSSVQGAASPVQDFGEKLSVLDSITRTIGNSIAWLGEKFAQLGEWASGVLDGILGSLQQDDFSLIQSAIGIGISGGVFLGIKKIYDMIKDFDISGIKENFEEMMNSVTNTFQAMQTKLKSEALLNIAVAIGVLTVSLLVLSSIDAEDLAKALTATAVGFGELAATMVLLTKSGLDPTKIAQLNGIAAAMVVMGLALIALSVSVKIMSTMRPEEMLQGMLGLFGLMAALSLMANSMPEESKLVGLSFALIGIALAINILIIPVQLLGRMDPKQLLTGLGAVGALLLGLTLMTNALDAEKMIATGLGILAIAAAITILIIPIEVLGRMDPKQLILGLLGVAGILLGITLAVNAMDPTKMAATGVGILAMAAGITLIAFAIKMIGGMDPEDLLRSLAAVAGILVVLALAAHAMSGAAVGIAGITSLSGALILLAIGLAAVSAIDPISLLIAIVAIAAVLLIFVVAATAANGVGPGMLALSGSMLAFAGGLALIGLTIFLVSSGIYLLVQAFRSLVDMFTDNSTKVIEFFDLIIEKTMEFGLALVETLLEAATMLIEHLPEIFQGLGEAIVILLDEMRIVVPAFTALMIEIIMGMLEAAKTTIPEFIDTGLAVLTALLQGISDNIENITNSVIDILMAFTGTMEERMPEIVETGKNLLVSFLDGIANNIEDVIESVINLIVVITTEIANNFDKLVDSGKLLVTAVIQGMGEMALAVIDAGTDVVIDLITGIGSAIGKVIKAAVSVVISFVDGIADNVQLLVDAGVDMIIDILSAMTNGTVDFANEAANVLIAFLDGLTEAIENNGPAIKSSIGALVSAIINELSFGLSNKVGDLASSIFGGGFFGGNLADKLMSEAGGIGSGSAEAMMGGFADTLGSEQLSAETAASGASNAILSAFNLQIANMAETIEGMDEFKPTISPVLDLTSVANDAGKLGQLLDPGDISAASSIDHANIISAEDLEQSAPKGNDESVPSVLEFNQTINSPKALTKGEIYRQTKSQLVMAKEELGL